MRYRIVEGLGSILHKPYALVISDWLTAQRYAERRLWLWSEPCPKQICGFCPSAVCLFWCRANEARNDYWLEQNRRASLLPKQGLRLFEEAFFNSLFFRLISSFKRVVTPQPIPHCTLYWSCNYAGMVMQKAWPYGRCLTEHPEGGKTQKWATGSLFDTGY